jgi:hypothetical protein
MAMDSGSLVAFLVAVSFAAGLNTYATVAVLGLVARFHGFALPPGLGALSDTWVIAASTALFAIEFFADKIPLFDVVWNALHTFIRLPVAALLAYRAGAHLSPAMQVAVTLAGTAIAAVAHTSKTAARVTVTPSPEPVSNAVLSGAEDLGAIGLTWIATRHPYLAAGAATLALLTAALLVHTILKALRRQLTTLRQRLFTPTNP